MGLRIQDISEMRRLTYDAVVARLDNDGFDDVTTEALATSFPLSQHELRGNGQGVTRGAARSEMSRLYLRAMQQADGIGTLALMNCGQEA